MTADPVVTYLYDDDARTEFEAEQRGYRGHVQVELADGRKFDLVFYNAVRLAQDIRRRAETGDIYFVEPTMVVVPAVTTEHINRAVQTMYMGGYFDRMLPIAAIRG